MNKSFPTTRGIINILKIGTGTTYFKYLPNNKDRTLQQARPGYNICS